MKKIIMGVVLLVVLLAVSIGSVALGNQPTTPEPDTTTGGGHTPVTICHKPGTPAQQELVVDDNSVELAGHLGHGDTIGPCPTTTTTTTTTEPTTTTPPSTTTVPGTTTTPNGTTTVQAPAPVEPGATPKAIKAGKRAQAIANNPNPNVGVKGVKQIGG